MVAEAFDDTCMLIFDRDAIGVIRCPVLLLSGGHV